MHDALILAAGFGTRLRPLTDNLPKALAPLNGKPLLDYVIKKLIASGIGRIIINTHYLSDKISEFLANQSYNAEIIVVHETEILGTGGAIKNIQNLIEGESFLIHNVDVVSSINLSELIAYHDKYSPLATMVMQNRQTYNQVLVDAESQICGLDYVKKQTRKLVKRPSGDLQVLAFCGIHVLSKKIFNYFGDQSFFSIIDTYLDSIAQGESVRAFLLNSQDYWKDVGTLVHLAEAGKDEEKWNLF